jgi:hypothetical protein
MRCYRVDKDTVSVIVGVPYIPSRYKVVVIGCVWCMRCHRVVKVTVSVIVGCYIGV